MHGPVELQVEHPAAEQDALVLPLVVLERERLPLVHVDDLAQVAVGDRPAELVAPRLVDPRRRGLPNRLCHRLRSPRSLPAHAAVLTDEAAARGIRRDVSELRARYRYADHRERYVAGPRRSPAGLTRYATGLYGCLSWRRRCARVLAGRDRTRDASSAQRREDTRR